MRKSQKGKSKVRGYFLKAFAALFVIALVAGPTVLHSIYGFGISPVLSGSMRPLAEPGDAFITVERLASTLKVGDIVTLHSAKTTDLYAHRLIDIRSLNGQMRIVTKGDSNPSAEVDPFMVSPNAKVPVTIARVLWLGHVLVYLTSTQGQKSALTLIVIANILALLLAMFKKKVKQQNPLAVKIYQQLFHEARFDKEKDLKKLRVYKELYEESRNERQTIKEN